MKRKIGISEPIEKRERREKERNKENLKTNLQNVKVAQGVFSKIELGEDRSQASRLGAEELFGLFEEAVKLSDVLGIGREALYLSYHRFN